jgi:hypothetical protein
MKEAYQVIDNFLSIEDLEMLSEYVDNNGSAQSRYKSKDIANNIYTKYVDKFKELGILGLSDEITISKNNKPITKHRDNKVCGETHKILIYLNNVNNGGGTYFYIDGKEILVENKINRLVLFDINIEHKGQEFSRDYIKKTIGFRTLNQDNIVESNFDA